MSQHTYTACYKVVVPPCSLSGGVRAGGVRLRESCAPWNEQRDFEVLYLPKQLRAQAAEQRDQAEHVRRGGGGAPPPRGRVPGWTYNMASEMDASLVAHLNGGNSANAADDDAEAAQSDRGLNGSLANKTRYALRHEFSPIRGADGVTTFAVKYQRGAQHTRKDKMAGGALAAAGDQVRDEDPPGGLPWWMRVEPHGVSLPRSTTQATYRAIPEESSLMNQRFFHTTHEHLPPATPCLTSRGTLRPPSPRDLARLKRLPLCSSEQPSLYFTVPSREAHPNLWRKSRTLRGEVSARKALESSARNRADMERDRAWEEEMTREVERPSYPASASAAATTDDLESRGTLSERSLGRLSHLLPRPPSTFVHPSGAMSARERPFVPHRPSTTPTAPTYASGANGAAPPPTKFQRHMQLARQKWQEQGGLGDEEM